MNIRIEEFEAAYTRADELRRQVNDGILSEKDMPFEVWSAHVGVSAALSSFCEAKRKLSWELQRLERQTGIDYRKS